MSINLAPQLTQRSYQWSAWKAVHSIKNGVHQYDDDGVTYTIWFYDGPEVHLCTIWKEAVPDGVLVSYSQEQNDADRASFEAGIKATANRTLIPTAADGRARVVTDKAEDASVTLYSHDWTDKTTWRDTAVRVVDEVASDSGDHTTYTLVHDAVIDTYHGKMTQEDFLKDADGHGYRVVVKVDDVVKAEQDPHYGTGGDYTVNYNTGSITFLTALAANAVVKVTYHHATSSLFTIRPAPGKKLTLALVECQFSADIELLDTAVFQPRGYVIAFAPQLAQSNGGPYPDLTLIPLGDPVKYKAMSDFQNDALRSYPKYPALGGSGWRGSSQEIVVFDWDYLKAKPLYSSMGMEIQIYLEHDEPFGGFYATATFYCGSEPE